MITAEKNIIRTPVEELLLREMVMEDADFLIDNKDSEDDDMIVDNTSNGLFDNESEDEFISTIIAAVDSALTEYSSDSIDVIINEETNCLLVMYHSNNNSFPFTDDICSKDYVDLDVLTKALDERHVGHCW